MADEREQANGTPPAIDETRGISCPGCATSYGVPPGLLPPWGGRIRCPRCSHVFTAGVLAEAEEVIHSLRDRDPEGWQRACEDRTLWGSWGEALLEGYRKLRERYGPDLASRAYRRALENMAPRVPWLAPPTPPSPLEPMADSGIETMFERRRAL
jgi:predicted Zn finger-like uncharacterized protein